MTNQTLRITPGEWLFTIGFVGVIVFGLIHFVAVILGYMAPLGVAFWLTLASLVAMNVGGVME